MRFCGEDDVLCETDAAAGLATTGEHADATEDAVAAFLREALKDGPCPAHELVVEGSLRGYDKAALRRARDKLGIRARFWREGDRVVWDWLLPEHANEQTAPNLPYMVRPLPPVPDAVEGAPDADAKPRHVEGADA